MPDGHASCHDRNRNPHPLQRVSIRLHSEFWRTLIWGQSPDGLQVNGHAKRATCQARGPPVALLLLNTNRRQLGSYDDQKARGLQGGQMATPLGAGTGRTCYLDLNHARWPAGHTSVGCCLPVTHIEHGQLAILGIRILRTPPAALWPSCRADSNTSWVLGKLHLNGVKLYPMPLAPPPNGRSYCA